MPKQFHEIRDPIHDFIRLDAHERLVIDSFPFQRLRHIHQLGLSHLVYPGATHRRFEHCIGVMELAGRVYDVVTAPNSLSRVPSATRSIVPTSESDKGYWRRVLRMAALCHDIGHLPFSHVAEDLLPKGWNHERLSVEIIRSDEMQKIWRVSPPLNPEDIAKLAVGQKILKEAVFTDWEALLSEIVVGDAFGVDRMDYLLRDSYHAGVPYGKVDHPRLIDTLRILPKTIGGSEEPVLGIEDGGLPAAEALLQDRNFMYRQVYLHPVRRIYDIHLKDFLKGWLPGGNFPSELETHLRYTDNEVMTAMYVAARDAGNPLHQLAQRVMSRQHFKLVYSRNPEDLKIHLQAGNVIFEEMKKKYGADAVRHDVFSGKRGAIEFPVLTRDDRFISSLEMSETLRSIPIVALDSTYVERGVYPEAAQWLSRERKKILESAPKPQED